MALSKEQLQLMVKMAASRVKQKVRPNVETRREVEQDDEDVSIGLHGILAASEKLLAVNRGLVPADERDSQQFKRIMTTATLLKERVRLDADKTRLNTLRQAAKFRSLKRTHPFLFDAYTEGHLLGNPLSSPLEEINPISLLESERRITQMGPGGLGSTDAITDEARALHPSQFGFLSSIEGPESEKIGIDTRAAMGTKIGSDGRLYQRMNDRRMGKVRWVTPEDLADHVTSIPD
jgi:DNA-directed RNA polymerase beta subunit